MSVFSDEQLLSIFEDQHSPADLFLLKLDPDEDDYDEDEVKSRYVEDNEMWGNLDDEVLAVMLHENCDVDEAVIDNYMVLTDQEAKDTCKEYADDYFNDYVLPEVPDHFHYYIDGEKWIADYLNSSSRGEILNSHDGCEYDVTMPDGTTLYLYSC